MIKVVILFSTVILFANCSSKGVAKFDKVLVRDSGQITYELGCINVINNDTLFHVKIYPESDSVQLHNSKQKKIGLSVRTDGKKINQGFEISIFELDDLSKKNNYGKKLMSNENFNPNRKIVSSECASFWIVASERQDKGTSFETYPELIGLAHEIFRNGKFGSLKSEDYVMFEYIADDKMVSTRFESVEDILLPR